MLRKLRLTLAVVFFVCITLLFLDFTGTVHAWFGWMARMQFLPAVLAMNVGVVLALLLLTLVCGRVYCSVICPLGVMQDIAGWLGGRTKKRRRRFTYSPEKRWLRLGVLALFVIALLAGVGSFVALLAPYSAFGRIAQNLFAPFYAWGNNVLAYLAERADSYAFYKTGVWLKSLPTFLIALATLVILFILAWRNGRTYCNSLCPVGTVLGYVARFSWFKPVIDTGKCNACGLCSRSCKASCIDFKNHRIDYTRCVACMDCLDVCRQGAITYGHKPEPLRAPLRTETLQAAEAPAPAGAAEGTRTTFSRRSFLSAAGLAVGSAALAQEMKVDGGFATIIDKQVPHRATPIVPPGALSAANFAQHCTACQLCVSVCPNEVLRPSTDLMKLMQPEMSYERGYCRPECTKCADVCPAGAIHPITTADKSATQIGHAVWIRKNCIPLTDGQECGNCARHCPTGAITMVPSEPSRPDSRRIPVVDTERCIGCGACENLCPARPFSAIYVEGHVRHRTV